MLLRYFEGLLKDLQFKATLFHTNRYYTIIWVVSWLLSQKRVSYKNDISMEWYDYGICVVSWWGIQEGIIWYIYISVQVSMIV